MKVLRLPGFSRARGGRAFDEGQMTELAPRPGRFAIVVQMHACELQEACFVRYFTDQVQHGAMTACLS
jgi:hypothetical protein